MPSPPSTHARTTVRRRLWRRWFVAVATLAGLLWLGMAYAVAYELTRRQRPVVIETLPVQLADQYATVTLHTADDERLGAWWNSGRPDRPVVVLFHGNGGCRTHLLPQAEWLRERGFGVLLVTLRAHGDSTGEHNDIGYSARHDSVAAVDWVTRHHADRPLVIWGQSIGGVAAMLAATETVTVDGYILECIYRDVDRAVRNRLKLYLPSVLSEVAYGGLRVVSPLVLPHRRQTSPLLAASTIPATVSVVLLAGGADRRATPAESREIAHQIRGEVSVVEIADADHLQLMTTDRTAYFTAVEGLLQRVSDNDCIAR